MAGGLDIGELFGRISLEDAFSSVLDKVQTKLEPFGAQVSGFGEKIKEGIEHPFEFAKGAASEFLESIGPLGAVVAVGTVAVAALGAGMFELASNASEAGVQVLSFSRITGVAVDKVGQLSAEAQIGGGSLDSLQSMLFQVQRRMALTGEGADKFNHSLEDLKINSDAFRAASPDEKIRLLSEGMRGASGSATMMSDAIAIMGRGAMTNLPLLMKDFDELKEKGEEVAYVWSAEDTKAAEEFEMATGQLKVGLATVATTIGVEVLPAATDFVNVIIRTGEALINLSGIPAYIELLKAMRGAIGEDALALQTHLVLTEEFGRRLKVATDSGLDLAAATRQVSTDMLEAGYSVKSVADGSGQAEKAMQKLKSETELAAKAGIAAGEAWERIDEAFSGFSDIEPEVRGLVKDMFDAKVSIEDMAKATGLSKDVLKSLTEQFKEAEKVEKEFTKGWDDLNSLGGSFQQTMAGVDKELAASVQYYANLGAKVDDLVKAFPALTKTQAEAAVAIAKQAETEAKAGEVLGGLWTAYFQKKTMLEATDLQKVTLNAEQEYEAHVKQLQDQGVTDVEYYNQLWALRNKNIALEEDEKAKQKKASLEVELQHREAMNQEEAAIQQHTVIDVKSSESYQNEKAKQIAKTLELKAAIEAAAAANRALGGSFTYDLSNDQGIAQYRKMNPAANISWSNTQIEDYIKKGGSLQGLINTGVINPYAGMGHAAMGADVMVGEHGPEVVRLPGGSRVFPTGTGPGEGVTFHNTWIVNGTGAQVAQQVSERLMNQLKSQRQYGAA